MTKGSPKSSRASIAWSALHWLSELSCCSMLHVASTALSDHRGEYARSAPRLALRLSYRSAYPPVIARLRTDSVSCVIPRCVFFLYSRNAFHTNKTKTEFKTLVPARRGRFPPVPPVGLLRPPNVETCICVLLTFYIPTRSLDPLALPFVHAARPVHPTSFHSRASGPVFISSRIFHTRHWSNRSARTVLIRTRHSK